MSPWALYFECASADWPGERELRQLRFDLIARPSPRSDARMRGRLLSAVALCLAADNANLRLSVEVRQTCRGTVLALTNGHRISTQPPRNVTLFRGPDADFHLVRRVKCDEVHPACNRCTRLSTISSARAHTDPYPQAHPQAANAMAMAPSSPLFPPSQPTLQAASTRTRSGAPFSTFTKRRSSSYPHSSPTTSGTPTCSRLPTPRPVSGTRSSPSPRTTSSFPSRAYLAPRPRTTLPSISITLRSSRSSASTGAPTAHIFSSRLVFSLYVSRYASTLSFPYFPSCC